ncbi:hypothetical protein J7T55_005496 [Diaporthe amygdali]|uniref:uncharacterized protein n=1 Tax=Phomopsis amygdali TaxID=1214568 RepID=UPI0022FEC18C|nr:uncharacterized protein J7T55_005496 [Diaporthe amygdali]KAJ0108949.1 hypothetical protein J7T55_005496 [Diaporthe amygdali]
MSASPGVRQPSDAGKEVHALSCVNCRQRKVKCSKTYPCPHCLRGGLECIFPSRKKDRRPRTNKNHELLNRLAKLEAIVGQVDPDSISLNPSHPPVDAAPSSSTAEDVDKVVAQPTISPAQRVAESELRNPQKRCPTAQPVSKDDPAAKYVSGEFWANLSREVEGIKATLEQPSDEDDDDDGETDGPSPESQYQGSYSSLTHGMSPPAILGNASLAEVLPHPPPARMRRLCDIYFRSVDPLMKIVHKPTIEKTLNLFMVNPADHPLSRTTEALFFAIYFAAVTSVQPDSCMRQLGEERRLLAVQYKQAVEHALARADYLNSTSLESLQAFMIYSTCLRNYAESRASWMLLALVHRLAQAIGLHRDGDGSIFSPYEAEMRRRLWAQLIVLDVRAAQDRGTEAMVRQEETSTIPPTNINDEDFGPDTTVPLPQLAKEGPTDITFSLCTYHCSKLFLYIHGPRSRFSKATHETTTPGSQVQPQVSEEDIIQRIKALEAQFLTAAADQPGHPQSAYAATVIRIASLVYWLSIQYPFQVRQPTIKPRVSREHMLQTAVAIMELQTHGPSSAAMSTEEYRERFLWWGDGYIPWHPLAVALAELCVQTEGPLVDRAWKTIDRVMPAWSDKVADTKKGALWRPIRKLLKQARQRRAEAQMRRLGISDRGQQSKPSQTQPANPPQTQARDTAQPQPVAGGPSVYAPTPPNAATPSPRPAGATPGRPPANPATELGPTGIPLAQEFGPVPDAAAVPPPFILQNGHQQQWTIDFTDMADAPLDTMLGGGGGGGGGDDFDMMDWSYWNDFVNDASVNVEGQTPSSSEGK